ncbi:prepilin-type N-terminal cleavage/methylation domain-containing protein [Weissella koreensis]|nr:prepilin-type N-terminal cleavage/methylation domain-containing protein [Weissella koreensis]
MQVERKAFSLVEVLASLFVLGIVAQMITVNVHQ